MSAMWQHSANNAVLMGIDDDDDDDATMICRP